MSSTDEAYKKYRESPGTFFEKKIYSKVDNERDLINPKWPLFWVKYHYNLVENGIMEILVTEDILNDSLSVMDIGVGTGHWIDFYTRFFDISEIWGVDFCEAPLKNGNKRVAQSNVRLLKWDVATDIPQLLEKKSFDIINAIGIMFHIVDDIKWKKAFKNLMKLLKNEGVAIFGGDFGASTVERGIMRKNRSYDEWKILAQENNAVICALKRYDWWAGADKKGITDNLLAMRLK